MTEVIVIAAVSKNGIIGDGPNIPWDQPADRKFFKRLTMGHPVIMGRKTFESLAIELPGRRNIVITSSSDLSAETYSSLPAAIKACSGVEKVFLIGGGEIYRQGLPLAQKIYLTLIHAVVNGDVTFPIISDVEWKETDRTYFYSDEFNAYAMEFVTYDRILHMVPYVEAILRRTEWNTELIDAMATAMGKMLAVAGTSTLSIEDFCHRSTRVHEAMMAITRR